MTLLDLRALWLTASYVELAGSPAYEDRKVGLHPTPVVQTTPSRPFVELLEAKDCFVRASLDI